MITLQTPGTGFDDFESRIALGLCRVVLDCAEPEQVILEQVDDRYVVYIDIENPIKINEALSLWIIRNIASEDFLQKIPGTRPKEIFDGMTEYKNTGKRILRKGHASKLASFGSKIKNNALSILDLYSEKSIRNPRRGAHDNTCGHEISKILGAILTFSPQLGSPPVRNNPVRSTEPPDVCPYCASLALIGLASFQIGVTVSRNGRFTKEKYFFIPRFRGKTNGNTLLSFIAVIKHVQPRLVSVPTNTALLALLSIHPHLCRTFQAASILTLFVANADRDNRGTSRFQHFEEKNIDGELMFLGDNPYNVALAQNAYRYAEDKPELLGLLSRTLEFKLNQDAVSFYREYGSITEGRQLVYKEVTKYIAKEVLGMDQKLIDDPNIGAIASMLKFFVSKQKFGYVDNLRGAKNPEEFEKHLLLAQRDAASIYSKPDDKKDKEERWLFLPNDNNVRELLKLLEGNFEKVKTLTCLLAFTYWRKEG